MVFFAVHRVFLVGLLEERIAHFHCGDALWRMRLVVGHIEITILSVSISNTDAMGRTSTRTDRGRAKRVWDWSPN